MATQASRVVVICALLIQVVCAVLPIAGYKSDTDVTDILNIDLEQQDMETFLAETPPNFDRAKYIYGYGDQSDYTLSFLSTSADTKFSGQAVFDKFKAYYQNGEYGQRYIVAALDGVESFSGQPDVARVQGVKKGTAYMNVWMYLIGKMGQAITDCTITAWDEAVAFYTGSLEGPVFSPGVGKLIYALADKRCENFQTCTSNSASSEVNTEIFKLFEQGQSKIKAEECTDVTSIMNSIVSYMSIPLIQGALRYAYKVAELNGEAKEKAEGAVFSAAVLPLVHDCNPDAAKTISDNMKIDSASPMKDGFAAVKTAFESTYSCLGITCEHVGGLLLTSTEYYPGARPCGTDSSSDSSSDSSTQEANGATKALTAGVTGALVVSLMSHSI